MTMARIKRFSVIVGALGVLTSFGAIAAEDTDEVVVKTGFFTEDIFVRGEHVSVRAEVDGDVVAMGSEVDVRSGTTGDVIAMGGDVSVDGQIGGEILAAGGHVEIDGTVNGGAVAMGGRVDIDGKITGPVLAVGGRVTTNGTIDRDFKIMGGKVFHEAVVNGDLLVAAGEVILSETSVIMGKAWLTGGRAFARGMVAGNLRVAARKVVIAGEVTGDVFVDGVEIMVLPSAVIRGNFNYNSPNEAQIHADAKIGGDIAFHRTEAPRHWAGFVFAAVGSIALMGVGGVILLGTILLLLCPNASIAAARNVGGRPWAALGVGFAILIAFPIAIIILVATFIGIPLAIFLLGLYVLIKMTGLLVLSTAVGMRIMRLFGKTCGDTFWPKLGVLVVGVLTVFIVALIPVIGMIALLIAWVIGTGALGLKVHTAYRCAPN